MGKLGLREQQLFALSNWPDSKRCVCDRGPAHRPLFPELADLFFKPQELFPPLQGEKEVQGLRGWASGQKAQDRSGGHPGLELHSTFSWENPSGTHTSKKGNNLNVHQEEVG